MVVEVPTQTINNRNWRSNYRKFFSVDNQSITDIFDEMKLALKPMIYPHQKGENILADAYHRFAGALEVIGYPSIGRHEKWIINNLEKSLVDSHNNSVLLCGAMSPISIAQMLDMMNKAGYKDGELTIVDISKTPYKSAEDTLKKIASRANIRLNFQHNDIRNHKSSKPYGAVIADQIYNFIDPQEWPNISNHLVSLAAKDGQFVNIIAMYRKQLGLGKNARKILQSIIDQHSGILEVLKPLKKYLYANFTNLINDQIGVILPGKKTDLKS